MKELTRDYICSNSPKFTEKLDSGCYNGTIKIIFGFIIFVVWATIMIYFLSKIIDLLKQK